MDAKETKMSLSLKNNFVENLSLVVIVESFHFVWKHMPERIYMQVSLFKFGVFNPLICDLFITW